MAIYGYARVSSQGQDLTVQLEALKKFGCEVIRSEKVTGTSLSARTELKTLLEFLRAGDTLVVTKIDRLARSMQDLQNIVADLKTKGVSLKAVDQPIDTGTAAGKAFLDMLGVFAEFETNLRRERQLDGIALAKEKCPFRRSRSGVPTDRDQKSRVCGPVCDGAVGWVGWSQYSRFASSLRVACEPRVSRAASPSM